MTSSTAGSLSARRRGAGPQRPGTTRTLSSGTTGGGLVRRTVLPGGLRVVTEAMPTVRSVTVGVWVGVGSRDEAPSQAGCSHYLEHLLFKGTTRRSALEISAAMDAVGGEMNAFTSKEYTCYYARVLDEDLPLALDMISDIVTSATVTSADVDSERGVILEEIAMHDDDPSDLVHDLVAEVAYGGSPLGRPVLGTVESITQLPRSTIAGYYRRRYRPEHLVVAVAGNVEHAAVVRQVRRAFGAAGFLGGDALPGLPRVGSRSTRLRAGTSVLARDTEQAHLVLALPGVSRFDERRFAVSVLNAALGGGMSSRLFQEVREKRGMAYSVYSYAQQFADTGIVGIYAGCAPAKVHDVLAVCREQLADVVASGLTDEELARGKGQLRGSLVLGLEDTGSRMTRIGKSELVQGEVVSIDEVLASISAVTSADVHEAAQQLLGGVPALAVVGPFDDPADLDAAVA